MKLLQIVNKLLVKKKYSSLDNMSEIKTKLPLVIEDKMLKLKTKEFYQAIEKILGGELFSIAIQKRAVRAGIGKSRGRKYKVASGVLLVIGNKEEKKINGIEVIKAEKIRLLDLASNGARLTMFTEEAIKDLD